MYRIKLLIFLTISLLFTQNLFTQSLSMSELKGMLDHPDVASLREDLQQYGYIYVGSTRENGITRQHFSHRDDASHMIHVVFDHEQIRVLNYSFSAEDETQVSDFENQLDLDGYLSPSEDVSKGRKIMRYQKEGNPLEIQMYRDEKSKTIVVDFYPQGTGDIESMD